MTKKEVYKFLVDILGEESDLPQKYIDQKKWHVFKNCKCLDDVLRKFRRYEPEWYANEVLPVLDDDEEEWEKLETLRVSSASLFIDPLNNKDDEVLVTWGV